MATHRTARHRLFLSFLLGLTVLLLSLAQGGPWPALAALGRGVGLTRPMPSELLAPALSDGAVAGPAATGTASRLNPVVPTPTLAPDDVGYSRVTTWSFPDEPRIDAMRQMIVNALKKRELTFDGASGRVYSFYPGDGYRKVWARDLSTMLTAVGYFYGEAHLRSGVEELLIRQYTAETRSADGDKGVLAGVGAVPGAVAPDGSVEKNTVTSDEETSAIHAAYQYYKMSGGVRWLKKDLGGSMVLDRLNAAMEWLYEHRFDSKQRLIKRGHTTDWGDVKFEKDIDPTDIDPKMDHWTASIYDQALAYRALRQLAEMNQAAGRVEAARTYTARANDLRQAVNRLLWMPERGYYRLHTHVTPLAHTGFDEDEMIAIGNAVAVYCGLTTSEQEFSIFRRLEEARLAAGGRKPGLSLYPAYPTGFFATTQRNRGEYQNGGLWDWWGGVQMAAEFRQGHSDLALAHLYQVAADWALHPDAIWEWSAPTSAFGRGAENYASAAGTVAEAIVGGLYGVTINRDEVRIEPRLGTHNGDVRVYQPATDRYVAYRYTYTPKDITIRYGTNASMDVTFRVRIPAGRVVQTVRVGGVELTPRQETMGNDLYIVFKALPVINTVTITLLSAPTGPTGLAIDPSFFDYYQNNQGLRLLGAPLTPALMEGTRRVQYFEKGKMEDHSQDTKDPIWRISYGLMGEELVRAGPDLPVGGEKSTVTYATLKAMMAEDKRIPAPSGYRNEPYKNKDGTVFIPFSADLSPAPGHNVAAIFWVVLSNNTRSPGGWLHDVGLPLTEAVWATVDTSSAKGKRIQIQAFQRAILTYDPQNTPGWQVERINLGVDYLKAFPDRGKP